MARYTDDFEGIPGGFADPRGMDPNYRGGDHGMRTEGWPDQAAYGRYRFRHRDDFGGSGGWEGGYADAYGRGPVRRPAERHPRDEWGAVRHPRYDREFLRDFNAYSPELRGRYDREMEGPYRGGSAPGSTHRGYDPRYTNRGISDAGYSQGWARGPMRGAR